MAELDPEAVVAASLTWVWVPESATRVETETYLVVRYPDWFARPLELVRLTANDRDLEPALDAALARAADFGLPEICCWAKLGSPVGLAERLAALGALDETVDVLARDLRDGGPDLDPPRDVELRWVDDLDTLRDARRIDAEVFGGRAPDEGALADELATLPTDHEGELVAYLGDRPVAHAGVVVVDAVARLWGGGVLEADRGRGVYRALLDARLGFGIEHGATMALVKGRVESSGPILRRAGFAAYGQERSYLVPLGRAGRRL